MVLNSQSEMKNQAVNIILDIMGIQILKTELK
jgi:hypothetical protein